MITLYDEKENCCGCGACSSICPKSAIKMCPDEYGFIYPQMDATLCVECGMCKQVCAFQAQEKINIPIKVYGAARKSEKIKESASGGIFSVLAEKVLTSGGEIYGAAMLQENKLTVQHICIDKEEDLYKLKGSKYVQSFLGDTFSAVKNSLENGKKVLFSGTPCQVSAIKGYLRKKYNNLFLVDIVCHGVPSNQFFQDYISQLEKKENIHVEEFRFRDKKIGWGLHVGIRLKKDKKESIQYLDHNRCSYYAMFLASETYRANCYKCKYACRERSGDITLGDFWGVQEEHPEVLKNGLIDERKGVSCVLVNTEKGQLLWEECKRAVVSFESSFKKVADHNHQLCCPSRRGKYREKILELYAKEGYAAAERFYAPIMVKKRIFDCIIRFIPRSVIKIIRKAIIR